MPSRLHSRRVPAACRLLLLAAVLVGWGEVLAEVRVTGAKVLARLDGASWDAVAFSAGGSKLLTAGGFEARVWDARTFRLIQKMDGYPERIKAAVLSPDSTRVATA